MPKGDCVPECYEVCDVLCSRSDDVKACTDECRSMCVNDDCFPLKWLREQMSKYCPGG